MRKLNDKQIVKVNIKDNNIQVIKGFDTLLFTDNNIMAYHKLINVLKRINSIRSDLLLELKLAEINIF